MKYARMSKGERKGLTFNLQGGGVHIFEMMGGGQCRLVPHGFSTPTCLPYVGISQGLLH